MNPHRRTDRIAAFTVGDNDPQEILAFLQAKLPEQKRTALKQMLAHNQIMAGGVVTSQFNFPLEPGQEVAVNFSREFRSFHHRRVQLIYEDDDILVINKGYGLMSMAGDGPVQGQETAYSIMRDWVKWQNPANKLFIVHRLDRDTSGLMLFAKTMKAKEALQHNWNNMVLERKYLCVVEGTPDPAQGVVRSYLQENSRHEVYSTSEPEGEDSKLAVTRYRTLHSSRGLSLVECELDTGRKNQIRVHMKELGTPIAGDKRYGGHPCAIHRMALHAQTLRFVHPVTRRDMHFATPTPGSFIRLCPRG